MSALDDVLNGAREEDARAIHRDILDRGGNLSDPAWIPFAAARRTQLETQRILPEWRAVANAEISDIAVDHIRATVADCIEPALKDLSTRIATTPICEKISNMTIAVVLAWGLFCIGIGFFGHAILTKSLTQPAPIAAYIANGNKLDWLSDCPPKALGTDSGRHYCAMQIWMDPPARPITAGPLPSSLVGDIPHWMQWGLLALCLGLGMGVGYRIVLGRVRAPPKI